MNECPKCWSDWIGASIPEKDREAFGGKTNFIRLIAIYDRGLDRTVGFRCPDCGFEFDRKSTTSDGSIAS